MRAASLSSTHCACASQPWRAPSAAAKGFAQYKKRGRKALFFSSRQPVRASFPVRKNVTLSQGTHALHCSGDSMFNNLGIKHKFMLGFGTKIAIILVVLGM